MPLRLGEDDMELIRAEVRVACHGGTARPEALHDLLAECERARANEWELICRVRALSNVAQFSAEEALRGH